MVEHLCSMDKALGHIPNTTDGWMEGRTDRQGCQSKVIHFFHAHRQKLHEADLELQRKREYIEELEPPTDSSSKWGSAVARARGSPERSVQLRDLVLQRRVGLRSCRTACRRRMQTCRPWRNATAAMWIRHAR